MPRAAVLVLVLACVALAGDDAPASAERLLADLASPDYPTRRRAVLACEGRTEPAIVDRLLAMAAGDPHPNIRGAVADVLAPMDDPRVFDTLAAMAQREGPGALSHVYVALGRHGDARARPILLAGLATGRGMRGYASKGLGLLGDPTTFEPVLEAYLAHLDDPYMHDLGVEALFRLDAERATAALLPRFTTFPAPARAGLARALGEHATPAVTRAMIAHLGSEDRAVREAAVAALALARDRDATEPLVAVLRAHPDEALSVIRALGALGDPRALPALADALASAKDPVTKAHAVEALARIGDAHAVYVLLPCLDDTRDTRQPRRISAVWAFPYNSRVDAAAVWAIRTLVDGKEPFEVTAITRFPDPVLPPDVAAEIPRIRAWWNALADRTGYTLAE